MSQSSRRRSLWILLGLMMGSLDLGAALRAEDQFRADLQADGNDATAAQLVLANELMRIHWTSWATDAEYATVVKNTIRGINQDFRGNWKFQWLAPEVVATERDAFEESAVKDIRVGEPRLVTS